MWDNVQAQLELLEVPPVVAVAIAIGILAMGTANVVLAGLSVTGWLRRRRQERLKEQETRKTTPESQLARSILALIPRLKKFESTNHCLKMAIPENSALYLEIATVTARRRWFGQPYENTLFRVLLSNNRKESLEAITELSDHDRKLIVKAACAHWRTLDLCEKDREQIARTTFIREWIDTVK